MPNYSFQENIVHQAQSLIEQGLAPVIQSHPGSGKTHMAITLAKRLNKQTLIIVPWKVIESQIKLEIKHEPSIQVMTTASWLNADDDNKPADIELLIFDEAHHAVTKSYNIIRDYYPNADLAGFTGTLSRMDGQGFTDIFDDVVEGPSVQDLVAANVLSEYELHAPNVDIPIFDKKRLFVNSRGEYSSHSLIEAIDVKKAYAEALSNYKALANGKTMILFAPSVELAESFAEFFNKHRIPADFISSKQPEKTRFRILNKFKRHELKILCNYNIISEGFNMPDCDGVILLRPTRSLALYIQQTMRALRYAPGKKAIIIDHTLNSQVFGTPTTNHLWRLESELSREKQLSQKEAFINGYIKKSFMIDTLTTLSSLDDTNERISWKNDLIAKIKEAINTNDFQKLISIQIDYKLGFQGKYAWAYMMAKTYNIDIPNN